MNRHQIIAGYTADSDEQILLARIVDRISSAERRNIPAVTSFLTQREQQLARCVLQTCGCSQTIFFGGTEGAERCICASIPDYLDSTAWLTGTDSPICCIRAVYSGEISLSHRDFLGALMGTGIKRETTGDIYISDQHCDFLVTREIAPWILQNLSSAGRARLSLSELPLDQLIRPDVKTRSWTDTVSALRLDSVVSVCFRISRTKAVSMITGGKVTLNHLDCLKPDAAVKQGDQISIRGMGKCRLASVNGVTRKGRISITVEKYI